MSKARLQPEAHSMPNTPRWVKVFGVILIILALLFAATHLTSNALGGPDRHLQSSNHREQQP